MAQSNFKKIMEFHTAFGLPCCQTLNKTNMQNFKIASLRIKLINEEFNELCTAKNLVEQLDAIGDLLYVVYGAGASFGIDMDAEFEKFYLRHIGQIQRLPSVKSSASNFEKTVNLHTTMKTKRDVRYNLLPDYIDSSSTTTFQTQITELSYAILICDVQLVIDILMKMLFSLYGVGYFCGYDLDKLFSEIHRSNMSKLCKSEREAADTVEWYTKNQLDRYPVPTYVQAPDGIHWVILEKTTDKRLKSINYSPPQIEPSDFII